MVATTRITKATVLSAAVVCLMALAQIAAASETRVALVMGNSNYDHVSALSNPINDTKDLGAALQRIGFDVTLGQDLDYRGMRIALRDFAEDAQSADIVLIYFAGHGIEIDNVNYLIPTNAELRSDRDVEFETVRLDAVIRSISDAPGLKIVLVDACRNNPFLSNMTRTTSTRSLGRGLGRIDPGGVLVGYAARGGTLALDGDGRNSPYAQALLRHIEEPGLELGKLFRKVRDTVYMLTDGFQEPFTYGSLPGEDIFLVPAAQPAPVTAAPAQTSTPNETPTPSAERIASADQLLREAIRIEDGNVKQGMLSMIARLYPETQSGRTAKYMAEHIKRRQATIAQLGQAQKEPDAVQITPAPPPTIDNNVRIKTNEDIEIALRLSRSDYRSIQRALNAQGFNAGAEDGIFGPRSRGALQEYQLRTGRPKTGFLTAETTAALKAVQPGPRAAAPNAAPTVQTTPVGYDGTYIVELRRRPDPSYENARHETVKTMLRLEYQKSGDQFQLIGMTDYSNTSGAKPRVWSASLSDSGVLRIRGTMNYLYDSVRPVGFSVKRQFPKTFAPGSTLVSEHGRFDDAFFVNVKVTRR